MSTGPDQSAELKFAVTNTLIVRDVKRSVAFYRDVLGATVLREREPPFLRLGNIWLTINGGGGGTDDRPDIVAAPPSDPSLFSNFINLRVNNYKTLLQALVLARREIHNRAQGPCYGNTLLHARSGRLPH